MICSIIVVFPKLDDAKKIREILQRHGFQVHAVCSTASQTLSEMNNLDGGIVVCGYKLPDMVCTDLRECMPASFDMLLIASGRVVSMLEDTGIPFVKMPLSVAELVHGIQKLVQKQQAEEQIRKSGLREREYGGRESKRKGFVRKARSEREQMIIDKAKELLMGKNQMTEAEAHRYIQKCSMDSGTNLVETAEMVLALHQT